jgi:tRNA uridine 5-carboxymethylaminomethyl modification enzyme
VKRPAGGQRAASWLKQPENRLVDLVPATLELEKPEARIDAMSVETALKYEGYLKRQEALVVRQSKEENRTIPREFPYVRVPGLSAEVRQRLLQVQPETLGQAMRIPGVTPAAIGVLSTYLSRLSAPQPTAENC